MFRIWISRTGSIPIREQLSAQLLFGILSHRLQPGERLPSVRELARRIELHPNTVSAAYCDLVERGWLRRKTGSGVFVGNLAAHRNDTSITAFMRAWIEEGLSRGFAIEEMRAAFGQSPVARACVVAHPDLEFARILAAEIEEMCGTAMASSTMEEALRSEGFVLTTASAVAPVAEARPDSHSVIVLKSVEEFLAGTKKLSGPALIAVVSRSESVREWTSRLARSLGLGEVIERDPAVRGWRGGLGACDIVAADILAGRELGKDARGVFALRMIAPSFLSTVREVVTGEKSVTRR